jgi:hypothetical protein
MGWLHDQTRARACGGLGAEGGTGLGVGSAGAEGGTVEDVEEVGIVVGVEDCGTSGGGAGEEGDVAEGSRKAGE